MSGAFAATSRRQRMYQVLGLILAVVGLLYGTVSGYFYLTASQAAERAELELKRGQLTSARSRLERLLWFHPHNAPANLALGKIELASGATEEAIACFRRIPPDSSLHSIAILQVATSLALDGQITAAESELEQYLQQHEPTESVWNLYFRLLYLQTRTRDVISIFEQKLSRPPQSLTDARFLLKAEFVPQDPGETRAALEEIRRKHPNDVNAQVAMAVVLLRSGEFTRASQLLRSVLEKHSDHHRARIVLSQWLADQQQFSAAEEVLWQTTGVPDPDLVDGITHDDRYWSLSSQLAEQKGETERSLRYIDNALQIRENDKQYLSQRAQILRQLLKPELAAISAQESIEAGQIEQQLFLLAREFENRPISITDCQSVATLYSKLKRPMRAELWEQLAAEMEHPKAASTQTERSGIP